MGEVIPFRKPGPATPEEIEQAKQDEAHRLKLIAANTRKPGDPKGVERLRRK